MFLGVLAENGALGFLALVLFFFMFFRLMRLSAIHVRDELNRKIAHTLLCGFIGFLLNGLIIDILTMRHFWILLAVCVSFMSLYQNEYSL